MAWTSTYVCDFSCDRVAVSACAICTRCGCRDHLPKAVSAIVSVGAANADPPALPRVEGDVGALTPNQITSAREDPAPAAFPGAIGGYRVEVFAGVELRMCQDCRKYLAANAVDAVAFLDAVVKESRAKYAADALTKGSPS